MSSLINSKISHVRLFRSAACSIERTCKVPNGKSNVYFNLPHCKYSKFFPEKVLRKQNNTFLLINQ